MAEYNGFVLVAAWYRRSDMTIETTPYATREEALTAHQAAIAAGVFCADVVDENDEIIAEYQQGKAA